MRGELVRVGYQWSVVSEFFQGTLSGEGDSLLTHFPFTYFPLIIVFTYSFPTSHLPIYIP